MGQGVLNGPVLRSATAGQREALFAAAGLHRVGHTLEMDAVPLGAIANGVGTPTFVYSADAIRRQFAALDAALGAVPHRIAYAVKANGCLAVLRILRDLGAGADIVSGGELARALAAGFAPGHIVFSGVGKSDRELEAAVLAGVGHVHLESAAELASLAHIAERAGHQVAVGIRVNPDVSASTHPYIATGQGGIKFGVPYDQVRPLAAVVCRHPHLRLDSIAMHLGSQLLEVAPYREGVTRLLDLVRSLRADGVDTLQTLDVGGGLGIRYLDESPLDPRALADVLVPMVREAGLALVLEPGRFLVGSAGVLLTEVLSRKHSGGKELVIVDAGMNDLVRPSHYLAYHDIVEVDAQGREDGQVDVVGPVCETGDFLALDRMLPGVERGERLAVLNAGAYGFVMSSNYNARPRAAEVLVDGGRWAEVRPRETLEGLFASEVAQPWP
ncbi:MAG: diaminopimelate decarboxylase [Gemmatimonadales bacterium]